MKVPISYSIIFISSSFLLHVKSNPVDLSPNFIFGSLRNATIGATSFISNSIQKQTDMIIQAKDTAKDYVTSAVAVPTKILNHAKEATRDYIDSTASRGMEIKFRGLVEMFRANMPYGLPFLDLPILEPMTIEHMDIDINHKEIGNLSSTIDNVTITKLSTFVVDDLKLSMHDGINLSTNLSVPTINAEGMYRVSGMMGKLFAVNASGPFDLEIHGAKLYVHTVLGFSRTMYVKSLNLDFSIETLTGFFHHLFPDPEVDDTVNQAISMMAPELIDVIKPEMMPKIEEIIIERLNRTIGRLTMGNIIGILTGTADINSLSHLATPNLSI